MEGSFLITTFHVLPRGTADQLEVAFILCSVAMVEGTGVASDNAEEFVVSRARVFGLGRCL